MKLEKNPSVTVKDVATASGFPGWEPLARASAAGVAETGLRDPTLTGYLAQGNPAVQGLTERMLLLGERVWFLSLRGFLRSTPSLCRDRTLCGAQRSGVPTPAGPPSSFGEY